MNKPILFSSFFAFGFLSRFLPVFMEHTLMCGTTTSAFDPYGLAWVILSGITYGVVALLVAIAVSLSFEKTGTTLLVLFLAGALLTADFAKPSRFEEGTYLDHAIHLAGNVHPAKKLEQAIGYISMK